MTIMICKNEKIDDQLRKAAEGIQGATWEKGKVMRKQKRI